MKKFLTLCVLCSILLFVAPALIADINKVDLSSNLSFTFEPSSLMVEPLTIIPFPDVDLAQIQNESSDEIKKAKDFSVVAFSFGLWLATFICMAIS